MNNQHGGIFTYKQYKSYIKDCKERVNADYHCKRARDNAKAGGNNGDWAYDNCMNTIKDRCKKEYIKAHGQPPSFISQLWN
jgi:hypothetical protein